MPEDAYRPPHETAGSQPSFYVLSGCSGSGKSSLLDELARRGYATVDEPGRQIVKEQSHIGGDGLPWQDSAKFLELVVSRSMYQFNDRRRSRERPVFFDRSIVDVVSHFERIGSDVPLPFAKAARAYRYEEKVFMTPPWREIFRNDEERRHSFEEAVAEYAGLLPCFRRLGYEIVVVPKLGIGERADFVLSEAGFPA